MVDLDRFVDRVRREIGEDGVLTGADAKERAQGAWAPLGEPGAVARPRSTEEVVAILEAANALKVPIVPWSGRTGLVEGGMTHGEVALSLDRMNRILEVDPVNGTATVEAGAVLQTVCETVEAQGLFFPLDLGARGSACIGGNISTNAGGNRVIRYGMMRDMVLGLEAVLADGTVLSSMNRMIKNNAGYDLKQLFIGSEGTLGIVTKAVLRLRPQPISHDTAFVAFEGFTAVTRFLRHMERALGGTLSAFEAMWEPFYKLVTSAPAEGRPPIPHGHPYYVLVEAMGGDPDKDAARFEEALGEALEAGDIVDAVIAKSESERAAMWALRDDVGQVLQYYPMFTFDVSMRLTDMEGYVSAVQAGFAERWNDPTVFIFGHLGDGNLHVIASVGDGSAEARRAVEEIVYRPLRQIGGSVSAEHGIGLEKRPYLSWSRSPAEIDAMRRLKAAFDPNNILNPGKVLDPEPVLEAAE